MSILWIVLIVVLVLALLGFVGLVPWTTSLAAQHLHDPLAVAVYSANLVMITLLDAVTWLYATGRGQLASGLSEGARQVSRRLVLIRSAIVASRC